MMNRPGCELRGRIEKILAAHEVCGYELLSADKKTYDHAAVDYIYRHISEEILKNGARGNTPEKVERKITAWVTYFRLERMPASMKVGGGALYYGLRRLIKMAAEEIVMLRRMYSELGTVPDPEWVSTETEKWRETSGRYTKGVAA